MANYTRRNTFVSQITITVDARGPSDDAARERALVKFDRIKARIEKIKGVEIEALHDHQQERKPT